MNWMTIRTWSQRNWKKVAAWGGGAVVVLLLFIVLVLPGIVRTQAEKGIFEATGRKASIAKISINPFTLGVAIHNFRYFEPDQTTPFVELTTIKAGLSLASLYRFAPVVRELKIESPRVRLVRVADNRYNFSDILDFIAKQPKPAKKSEARFSINNISVANGSIDFDDRAIKGGKQHTIRDLQLAIPFISNIPYLAEKYTDPKLSAVVNGARFDFGGKAKPLAKSVEASINLKLDSLNLPYYLAYLPADIPVKLDKGSLTLDLNLNYKMHASKQPELTVTGLTRLDRIAVSEKNSAPLVAFNRFDIRSRAIELFSRKAELEQVVLDGLTVQVSRDAKGMLNFQKLLPAEKSPSKQAAKPQSKANQKESLPNIKVDLISLTNATVNFNDAQPKGGFKTKIDNISVKVTNLATQKDAKNSYEVALQGDSGEKIGITGTAVLTPLSASAEFDLADVKLERGWPYLQTVLTAPIKGVLGLHGKLDFSAQDGVNLHDTALSLQKLQARFGDKDGVDLTRLDLNGIAFNQKNNRAEVGEITLQRGKVAVSREADGAISAMQLLVAQPKPAARPSTPVKTAAKKDEKQLSWLVKKIAVSGLGVSFKDKTFQDPPAFNLNNIRLATGNLSGPKFSPMPLKFNATFGSNAPLHAVGTLTPQPFRYKGSVSFNRLPIRDFEDYVPDNINVFFVGGTLDSSIKLDVALDSANKPSGSFSGNLGLRGFHAVDTVQEEDLLKWESLQLDEIKGRLAPMELSIRQIALNGVFSRIAIRKDGTLNLQNLVTKETGSAKQEQGVTTKPQEKPATPPPANSSQVAAAPPSVRIDNLTIQDGTMLFSDVHLPQQFRTTFYNLGGRVSGLSSEMNQFADVDLRGNLENHSPLQIKGRVNPLRSDLFVDLTISFKDIDLTPATPYAGTYLGYAIDKGKLNLDLQYHIENKNLKAENKVFVDQFTFGQSVASDKATKLPVRLGVALLKDRKGEIHLDLPVSGRTDDPKLSIWGLVWQVVVNLFVKAATSPFAILSSMMGSSEDLSAVAFAPGSSTLAPTEQQKLSLLAKALADRPALKVEIKGFVDREKDAEGYRHELLNRKIRQEKLLELTKSKGANGTLSIDMITIQPQEYSQYLKAVYQKEKFPKPRNFIGMLKDLPDAEMKKLIITHTLVGDQELRQLANDRVAAVRNYLIVSGKVPQERLFQKGDDIYKPSQKEKIGASRAELNPIAP